MEEPSTEPAPPTGKEPESASPPAAAPAAAANEQEVAPVEATYEEQPVAASESGLSTPSKAQVVFRDTQQLFQRLSVQARDAAVVAGQKLDQAALSLGAAVDNYAIQIGNAYDQHVSKELAQAVESRERHRTMQETNIPPERQEQIIVNRSELVEQCLTLTGDIQQEIQYATKENPLGRESYGLMMLCNVLVPILEHGLRQDWRSVLPAATVLSSSSKWTQSLVKQARGAQPTAFDVLEAADQGWGSNGGQVGALGIAQLEVTGLTGGRKVQGWLYDSLNKGLLAGRIQALMLMSELLEDWYFSWGLLRTEGSLQDVLMELVKIESQEGMIELPVDQLLNPAGTDTNMNGWTQKMKDTFHAMGGRAREASKIAYHKASESYSRVASAVRTQGSPSASGGMATGLEDPTTDTQPGNDSPLAGVGLHAAPTAGTGTVAAAAPVVADGAATDAGYVDDDDEDDEDGMIVHAGFGAPQKPVSTSAVGGPVFLGLDDEEEDGDAEGSDDASAPSKPAQS